MDEEITDGELKERYEEFWGAIRKNVMISMFMSAVAGGFFALFFLFLIIFFLSV